MIMYCKLKSIQKFINVSKWESLSYPGLKISLGFYKLGFGPISSWQPGKIIQIWTLQVAKADLKIKAHTFPSKYNNIHNNVQQWVYVFTSLLYHSKNLVINHITNLKFWDTGTVWQEGLCSRHREAKKFQSQHTHKKKRRGTYSF